MTSSNIHFSSIKIEGYRGRNFELKMKPPGKHTVFQMEGNTGKTTTIELLRWCFNHPESSAEGKFRHMYDYPAHVLDHDKSGEHTCIITINFSSDGHDYMFRRTTRGEYSWESDEKGKLIEDKISKIEDVLEVGRGADVYRGDDAHRFINLNFRFNQCADYFCFDGERAREIMQFASDKGQIHKLIETVDRRVTHPKLELFIEKLSEMERKVFDKVRKEAGSSSASDTTIKLALNKIQKIKNERDDYQKDLDKLDDEIRIFGDAIRRIDIEISDFNQAIDQSKSQNLLKRKEIEMRIREIVAKINSERVSIYKNILNWISIGTFDIINKTKIFIRERGKLPEPYRKDLIDSCLHSIPATCQICGRELDKDSEKRVKRLGEQIAPHPIQEFLSFDLIKEFKRFDPLNEHKKIKDLSKELDERKIELESIKLSNRDEKLISDRDERRAVQRGLIKDLGGKEDYKKTVVDAITVIDKEISDLRHKIDILEDYKIIFDEIDIAKDIIYRAQDEIKEKTRDIISKAISKSVSSILGPTFSAKLTEDHLYLGENDKYSVSIGGYSGRLVLSYCFGEAMTLIDPMVIDTPSGNIGIKRRPLAEHLKANHKQVILLCLPTELEEFAPVFSDKVIEVKNNTLGGN